ncbi:hypothetical protein [Cereibacter changlensis]
MFMLCKHALPGMRDRRSGAIINISSTSSLSNARRWPTRPRKARSTP